MPGFVDRVVDGVAVILLEHGGRAYVPVSELPPGTEAGRLVEVTFTLLPVPQSSEDVEAVAQVIERLRESRAHRHG
ncbi:MAG: DUF3006 family protein [Armatimonadota bacterium]|nr:DUF3006 family protein [Armatimonadota bacterium]